MAQYAKDFQQSTAVNESSQNLIINDNNVNAGKNLLRLTFTALKNWLSGLFVSKTQNDTKQGDLTIEGGLNVQGDSQFDYLEANDIECQTVTAGKATSNSEYELKSGSYTAGVKLYYNYFYLYHKTSTGAINKLLKWNLIDDREAYLASTLQPATDDYFALGTSSLRWREVYAVNGTIQTSDRREKRIYRITNKERTVAAELRSAVKKFKWLSAIDNKGEQNARFHFGWVAQDVIEIFDRHGLDAMKYGLVGHDVWYETADGQRVPDDATIQDGKWIRQNEDGTTEQIDVVKKDRYTVRPTEIIAFIFINSF